MEEKKLLRHLIEKTVLVALTTFSIGLPAFSQEEQVLEFAPGAQGDIKPSIMQMLDNSKKLGEAWKDQLNIQKADDFGVKLNVDDLRTRALNNPRVRALLDADSGEASGEAERQRYENHRVFLFLSFSMPEQVLHTAMVEAKRFDVPIIMRGFVNNSVFDTQTAIQRVFKDDAESIGYGIDPTMFTRFNVNAVPQIVVVTDHLDVCETQGCELDVPPPHDKIAGNIPIEAALEIVARGGEASEVAAKLLEEKR
jgi:conjugal transfer pilus assembly protein TrbC